MAFGISYNSDLNNTKQVIDEILTEDSRVLTDPAPQVFLQKLADSSPDNAAFPFVGLADFLNFQADIVEQVKKRFDAVGSVVPYPQHDIHLVKQDE